ncbi:hypothetical protein BOTCAL_0123g00190 [Botryotinia calthae]|uniref:Uncharacterized protein n=1 Tax=Botryotinia calthae TaxID=38488 RepID=A0A4Y8D713_9HELO|nr:hypothetical protein BOTCAL_0123g00190 [Botryotinia calthae]
MIGPVKEAVEKQRSGKFTNEHFGSGTQSTQNMFGQNYSMLRQVKRNGVRFHQQNTTMKL